MERQPGHKTRPEVEVLGLGHAELGHAPLAALDDPHGDLVGLCRRFETRDAPHEHELRPRRVFHREADEHPGRGAELVDGIVVRGHGLVAGQELQVPLQEHGVVDGVLGVEVRVQRGCPHADLGRQVAKRQRRQALGPHYLPGRVEDLRLGRLTAFGTPIEQRFDQQRQPLLGLAEHHDQIPGAKSSVVLQVLDVVGFDVPVPIVFVPDIGKFWGQPLRWMRFILVVSTGSPLLASLKTFSVTRNVITLPLLSFS